MRVYNNIYLLNGVGFDSNVYIVDGELIVDTGSGMFFQETVDEMMFLRLDPRKIKLIINTHHHFDHTGADKLFRDISGADIAIHEADRENLEKGETNAEIFGSRAKAVTASRILRDGDIISTRNFTFEVIHTPGHTNGSICLYERSRKILFSGDTLLSDGMANYEPGYDGDLLKDSLEALLDLRVMYLFPGHGNPKIGGVSLLINKILKDM